MDAIVWTIGHSNRSIENFVELLSGHDIETLVDVRSFPRSRRNPQFDRERLPAALEAAAIAYRHEPGLGGRRRPRADSPNTGWRNAGFRGYADYMQSADFAAHLERLLVEAQRVRASVMCAEAVPWRCHRSLIADALLARGVAVRHILGPERADPHRLTPFARIDGTRVTYPGLV